MNEKKEKKHVITRKIQIRVFEQDTEKKNEFYKKIRDINEMVMRMANTAATHMYIQKNLGEFEYIANGYKKHSEEIYAQGKGFSPQNRSYKVLSNKFGDDMAGLSDIMTNLNCQLMGTFNAESKEYFTGHRSLRTYRRDIPVPFSAKSIRDIRPTEDKKDYHFTLFNIPFVTRFGRDYSRNKLIWGKSSLKEIKDDGLESASAYYIVRTWDTDEDKRTGVAPEEQRYETKSEAVHWANHSYHEENLGIVEVDDENGTRILTFDGDYKLCNSSFQFTNKGKLILNAVFTYKPTKKQLDATKTAEAFLSPEYPIIFRHKQFEYRIGHRDEFFHQRNAIQQALWRQKIAAKYNSGGKGRKKKMASCDRFEKKEHNYVQTRQHTYSKMLIDQCIEEKCGIIILRRPEELLPPEELHGKERQTWIDANNPVLRNWGYHGLMQKIEYKCRAAGIKLIVEGAEVKEKKKSKKQKASVA